MEEVFQAAKASDFSKPKQAQKPIEQPKPQSAGDIYFPRASEAQGPLKKTIGAGLDALSLPGRAADALITTPTTGDPYAASMGQSYGLKGQKFEQDGIGRSLAEKDGKGVGAIVRDPAFIPSMAIGGPALGAGFGKLALSGLGIGAGSAALHQGDRISRGKGVNLGEATLETAVNTALPVVGKGVGHFAKKSIGGLKTILSKFSDVDESALKAASNPEALNAAQSITKRTGGDLSEMADNLGKKTEALQADELNAVNSINSRRQGTLEEGIQKARPWGQDLNVSGFDAGKRIESAAQSGMKSAGERFGRNQDEILINRGIGKNGLEFGGIDGNQNPFEQTVDRFLEEAGVGQGGKNYGVIGNVSIPAGAINEIRQMKETFKSALNTRDMLDQLRLVDNKLDFGGEGGTRLFARGSQEDLAMKGLRSRLADDLENQIGRAAGKKDKNAVIAAWNAHREAYHKTSDAFEKIQDGIGAGKVNQETYFNRIKNIGIDDLRSIAEEAKKNPDLSKTWNELRKGYFDNIIASGIKDDGIDYQAMKKTWDAIPDDLKSTMMPLKVISHVDGVLERTKPIDFKGNLLADNNRFIGRDRQSTLGSLENIGSKAKRTDLEDLKTLDDLLGLEGKDRFSEQAGSFYLGKQLGLTDKGTLPLFTGSRNGAKLAGAGLGATAGGLIGTSQGGAEGGSIGGGMGMIAGVAIQSPAGALAAYKILNQLRKGVVMTERNITRPMASRGLSVGNVTRKLTTPLYGGE
jgi:hypothetical protein